MLTEACVSSQQQRPFPGPPCQRTSRLRYGLQQEAELRRGLRGSDKLIVHYSPSADAIYKIDAVVRFRNAPLLPAVGIQFTTKSDPDKMHRTIAAVRRSRIVSRMLYLETECPLTGAGVPGDPRPDPFHREKL